MSFNQFKDTTIYGNFNNSNKANPSLTAQATFDGTITGKNNIYCNGDLYLGTTTESVDPVTGLGSIVGTGGNICVVNEFGLTTTYPASILATLGTAVTTTYLNQVLSGFLQPSNILTNNVYFKTLTGFVNSTIYAPANTGNLFYQAVASHIFGINDNSTNVFSIGTSGVSSTLPISSTSTINGLTLQENGTELSSKYQAKESSGNPYVTSTSLATSLATSLSSYLSSSEILYLTSATASTTYQPKETFENPYVTSTSLATSLNSYLTSATAETTYQAKGTYLTSSDLSLYLTSALASTTYQAKETTENPYITTTSLTSTLGSYLTSSTASLTYVTATGLISRNYVTSNTLTTTLGSYVTNSSLATSLSPYLTSSTASTTYQPKEISTNPYATVNLLSSTIGLYVPISSLNTRITNLGYLLSSTAATTYQAKGNYLLSSTAETTYADISTLSTRISGLGFLLISSALGTFPTKTDLYSYLLSSTASSTYQAKETVGNPYITSTSLATTLGSYITSSSLSTTLSNYVSSTSLSTTLGSYITTTSLATSLSSYLTTATAGTTYQTKSFTATIKCLSYVYSKYVNQSINSTLYGFWFYDNNGFYLEPKTDRNIVVNNALYFISSWGDSTVQLTQNEIPYLINQGLQIRFANPSNKKYTVLLNGIHRSDNQTTNQGLFFQINQKTNITLNGVNHSSFYIRWSYNHLNTFLDTQTTDSLTEEFVRTGLFTVPGSNPGNIDLCVTLI